ncbi:MAG: SIR2 family protein [Candidatus Kariarchaeaceae archaeon]|jgi:hypothetical protein
MITLFFGAGASKAFGYPTTVDFIKIAEPALNSSKLSIDIYDYLKSYKQIVDIEMVLWEIHDLIQICESLEKKDTYYRWLFDNTTIKFNKMAQQFPGLPKATNHFKSESIKISDAINKLVYDTYWQDPKGEPDKIYKTLINSLSEQSISIFTTNYDLLIERSYMNEDPGLFTDGFDYVYGQHIYWNQDYYSDSPVKLYKLHGSLNWKRQPDGLIYKIPVNDFTKHDDHVIIYPGFKGLSTVSPFDFMHERFKTVLLESQACIFIGFSFRDEYINKIIFDALEYNSKLKLVIWNPNLPTLKFPDENIINLGSDFGNEETIHRLRMLLQSNNLL